MRSARTRTAPQGEVFWRLTASAAPATLGTQHAARSTRTSKPRGCSFHVSANSLLRRTQRDRCSATDSYTDSQSTITLQGLRSFVLLIRPAKCSQRPLRPHLVPPLHPFTPLTRISNVFFIRCAVNFSVCRSVLHQNTVVSHHSQGLCPTPKGYKKFIL